jgi:TctA family transporter
MAYEPTMPDRLDAADGPAMATGGSPLRSMVAASVALALVTVIQFALPYPAEARYVLVVFALAIVVGFCSRSMIRRWRLRRWQRWLRAE